MYKIITAVEAFSWPRKTNSVKTRMKFINKTMREIRKATKSGETRTVVRANLPDNVDAVMAASFLSSLGYKVVIREVWSNHHFVYHLYIRWSDKEVLKYIENDVKVSSELAKNSVTVNQLI